MKKFVLVIAILFSACALAFSQDTIYTRNEGNISANVLEILPETIKYKKAENPGGPLYTIEKANVIKIVYANGSADTFAEPVEQANKVEKAERPYKARLLICIGPTYTTFTGDAMLTKYKWGMAGGLGFQIPMDQTDHNFMEYLLMVDQKGSAYDDQTLEYQGELYELTELKQMMDYVTLSISYKRFLLEKKQLFLSGGLYAGYLYRGELEGNATSVSNSKTAPYGGTIKEHYADFDGGVTLGLGTCINIGKGIYAFDFISEIRYNHGLANIFTSQEIEDVPSGYSEFNSGFFLLFGIRSSF